MCYLCGGEDNDFNVQAMKTRLMWTIWTSLSAVRERPLNLITHSPKQHKAMCIISSSYVNSNYIYGPEMAKLGFDLCDLDLWSLTLTFCMDITSVIGNNIENFMMIRWCVYCDYRDQLHGHNFIETSYMGRCINLYSFSADMSLNQGS